MSALIDSYLDLLAGIGEVTARRMFGGHGFFKDGGMFALEAYQRLFIKADADNKQRFVDAGCAPFAYEGKDGREMVMSYFEPPESAFSNPQKMKPWAMMGVEAARRAAAAKLKSKKPKSRGLKSQNTKPKTQDVSRRKPASRKKTSR